MKNDLILAPQRITSTTVKVRRLGYLVSIPSIIQDREIQFETLKSNVFNWAKENRRFFEHYSLELPVARARRRLLTGEIKTVGAAERYINTCEELGFITKVRGFRTSKTGKAISGLSRKGNPFHLSLGQTFLTLRSLLEKDYDSLRALVKILDHAEDDRIELFRKEVQGRLYRKIQKAQEMNKLYVVDLLKSRIVQIQNWRKPKRYYLENIEAPRIEWMLDLKFIKHWNQRLNSFDTEDHLCDFFENDIIGDTWLQDEFPIIFAGFYEKMMKGRARQWSNLEPEDRLGLLNHLLKEGMALFKTGAEIGKISAKEFFDYSAASLIENQSILVSPISEFERDLIDYTRTAELEYRYVQTVSPADKGYIVKV